MNGISGSLKRATSSIEVDLARHVTRAPGRDAEAALEPLEPEPAEDLGLLVLGDHEPDQRVARSGRSRITAGSGSVTLNVLRPVQRAPLSSTISCVA